MLHLCQRPYSTLSLLPKTSKTMPQKGTSTRPHLVRGEPQVLLQESQLLLWRTLGCQEDSAAAHHTLDGLPINAQLLQRCDAGTKHVVRLAAQRLRHLLRMCKSGSKRRDVSE